MAVTTTAEFALSGSEFAGCAGFLEVRASAYGGEEFEGRGGFDESCAIEGGGRDDEGNFGDRGDFVAAGQEEGGNAGGGDGGGCCESSGKGHVSMEVDGGMSNRCQRGGFRTSVPG